MRRTANPARRQFFPTNRRPLVDELPCPLQNPRAGSERPYTTKGFGPFASDRFQLHSLPQQYRCSHSTLKTRLCILCASPISARKIVGQRSSRGVALLEHRQATRGRQLEFRQAIRNAKTFRGQPVWWRLLSYPCTIVQPSSTMLRDNVPEPVEVCFATPTVGRKPGYFPRVKSLPQIEQESSG